MIIPITVIHHRISKSKNICNMDVNTMLPPMTVTPIPMTFANLGAFSPVILERLYQCI